jgi:arylsulfatase
MPERPNIVLIITDHFRGDCLSRLNHPVAETPHIDSMSREGAMFTRGYTPCPSCVPARRTLMTGQTPYSAGMVGYQDGMPWQYPHTMAGELTRAGYQTINIGKTHFHPRRLHLGFEQLITPEDYEQWLSQQSGYDTEKYAHGIDSNSWMARPNHLPEHMQEETWFVNRARDFLDKRDPTRPFFLCLSFNGPHPPWCPPQVYYDQFIHRDLPGPDIGDWAAYHADDAEYPLDVNAWRGRVPEHTMHRARAAYYAYLAYLDAQVGRINRFLQRSSNPNTFVLFTSDHGEMLGDHNLWRKTYAYEASARVPFVVKAPRSMDIQRNREIRQVVGWEDIMPTFLDVAGAPIPDTVEGRSILPLLRGEESGWRDTYHGEHAPCYHPENANQFLTDAQWKYIWNPITGQEQLFDLLLDPNECRDLSTDARHDPTRSHFRDCLARKLKDRAENLSDGTTLTPGKVSAWVGGDAKDVHLG